MRAPPSPGWLVFAFMAVLPGDPAEVALGVNATPEAVAALREQFGTDRPPIAQFLDWFGGLRHTATSAPPT